MLPTALHTAVSLQLLSTVLCQFPLSPSYSFPPGTPPIARMGPHLPPGLGPHLPPGLGPHLPPGLGPHLPSGLSPQLPPGLGPPMATGLSPQLPPGMGPPGMPYRMPGASFPPGFPMQNRIPAHLKPYDGRRRIPKKKRRARKNYNDSRGRYSSGSGSEEAARRSFSKRRQVLTPVVSYVTNDGYVVYQKKIKKEKAKDWLEMNKRRDSGELDSTEAMEMEKKLYQYKKSRRNL